MNIIITIEVRDHEKSVAKESEVIEVRGNRSSMVVHCVAAIERLRHSIQGTWKRRSPQTLPK